MHAHIVYYIVLISDKGSIVVQSCHPDHDQSLALRTSFVSCEWHTYIIIMHYNARYSLDDILYWGMTRAPRL